MPVCHLDGIPTILSVIRAISKETKDIRVPCVRGRIARTLIGKWCNALHVKSRFSYLNSIFQNVSVVFYRFVHGTCDPEADLMTYHQRKESNPEYEYVCSCCRNKNQTARLVSKRASTF